MNSQSHHLDLHKPRALFKSTGKNVSLSGRLADVGCRIRIRAITRKASQMLLAILLTACCGSALAQTTASKQYQAAGVIMRAELTCCFTLLLTFASALLNAQAVYAQEPVLESYVVSHGGVPGTRPDGLDVKLTDKYFGNGTASARIRLKTKGDSGRLSLSVYREVVPGEVTFALLVFHVEVRAYDAAGLLVYSRDLNGFRFGDSKSGEWQEELNDLSTSIQQLNVVFIGNYE